MTLHSGGLNIHLKATEHDSLEWAHLAQGWVQWLSPINKVTHWL